MSKRFLKYITRLLLVLSIFTQSIAFAVPVCDMEMSLASNSAQTQLVQSKSLEIKSKDHQHSMTEHDMSADITSDMLVMDMDTMIHDECCEDCQCVEGHCSSILMSNMGFSDHVVPPTKQLFTAYLSNTNSVSSSLYRPPIIS
jgi:hypothetical protein